MKDDGHLEKRAVEPTGAASGTSTKLGQIPCLESYAATGEEREWSGRPRTPPPCP